MAAADSRVGTAGLNHVALDNTVIPFQDDRDKSRSCVLPSWQHKAARRFLIVLRLLSFSLSASDRSVFVSNDPSFYFLSPR